MKKGKLGLVFLFLAFLAGILFVIFSLSVVSACWAVGTDYLDRYTGGICTTPTCDALKYNGPCGYAPREAKYPGCGGCVATCCESGYYCSSNNIGATCLPNPPCVPYYTCAIQHGGRCGFNLYDGCGYNLNCPCPTGYTCNAAAACVADSLANSTYWANLIGENITTAQLGDSVMMTTKGVGFGPDINFSVWKPTFMFWKWVTPLSATQASSLWIANETLSTVYFKTKLNNVENVSKNLSVSATANNARPQAVIVFPGDNYFTSINASINFTQRSYDEDDLLNISWNFGDNKIFNFTNYTLATTPTLADISHNYSVAGDYLVTLNVQEATRSQNAMATRAITVLDSGLTAKAIISYPVRATAYGNFIDFYAGNSYVINCTRGIMNKPNNFTVGNLNCSYIHEPGKLASGSFTNYDIILNWTVRNQVGVIEWTQVGSWANNYSQVVNFTRFFSSPGAHNAYLEMTYAEK